MELTIKEMQILSEQYSDADQYSIFNNLGKIRGEGSLDSLTAKGVYENGKLNSAMKAVLDVLAYPERVASFRLEQLEVNMRKKAYIRGKDAFLLEFHRENVIISTLETELDSVRTEISNHTGVAFQKHSQLNQVFDGESLLCLAGLADWIRQIALSELTESSKTEKLSLERFEQFLSKPLKMGLLSQIQSLTHLKTPDRAGVERGLKRLIEMRLVETIEPKIEADKSTILLGINFLIPNMAITLELYDLSNPEKVLMAREQIIQATPKDNLSISANANGYHLLSLTASEVLEKIIAYLGLPKLS